MAAGRLLDGRPALSEDIRPAIRSRWRVPSDPVPRLLELGADRLPLVGRSDELTRLRQAWAAVLAGSRQIVSLVGEPGIGKTRLLGELAAELVAGGQAGGVLYGACDEEAGIPYQPFSEALTAFLGGLPVSALQEWVGAAGIELVRLVPDLARRLPEPEHQASEQAPVRVDTDHESARWRLFDTVAALLRDASREAPLVLALDDLHWASKPTLLLLRHVVRATEDARLLIVLAYRDTDLGRSHPLADALGQLRRSVTVDRISVGRLDEQAVRELIEQTGASEDDPDAARLAHAVQAETEGNPFFVGEMLRHLHESGLADESPSSVADGAMGLPEGIAEVVGRRLSRLSDGANQALAVAAVAGMEVEFAVLETVPEAGGDSETLLDAIDEALAAGLLEEAGGGARLRFTHALVRQTLYDELSGVRRARLHRRVGEALEAVHAANTDGYVVALARHFAEAGMGGDVDKAAGYALRAGQQAGQRLAFEEAIEHFERGLQLLDLDATDHRERQFELLYHLAEARNRAFDVTGARQAQLDAAAVARDLGSSERLCRAALVWLFNVLGALDEERVALCDEALEVLGNRDPGQRARLLTVGAILRSAAGAGWTQAPVLEEALGLARACGDLEAEGSALSCLAFALIGSGQLTRQLAVTEELLELAEREGDPSLIADAVRQRAIVRLTAGDRAGVEADLSRLRELGERTNSRLYRTLVAQWRAMLTIVDGQLDEAERLSEIALGMAPDQPNQVNTYTGQVVQIRWLQGRLDQTLPMMLGAVEANPGIPAFRAGLALAEAENDMPAEALADLAAATSDWSRVPLDSTYPANVYLLSEVCALIGGVAHAQGLWDHLVGLGGQMVVAGPGTMTLGAADRPLGMLALLLGDQLEAERRFEDALALEAQMGSAQMVARTAYWYARLLHGRKATGDLPRALTLVDDALGTTEQLGMERLHRDLQELRAQLN
jgi:tetratricopeptide (TPR) repeat protein